MSKSIRLQITAAGGVQMLHDDRVDLTALGLGPVQITRASHVEWCSSRRWIVLSAKTGKLLAHGFVTRAQALEWESDHYSPTGAGWRELTETNEKQSEVA